MFKKPHCCALVLGILLLVLAAVLVLRVNHAADTRAVQQTARAAEALTHLQSGGCLTCHTATATTPDSLTLTARHAMPATPYQDVLAVAAPDAAQAAAQAAVDAELVNLGTRLLALPDAQASRAGDAVETFVQIYDQTRAISAGELSPQDAAPQLARLSRLIQSHENQASPYQMAHRTVTPPSCDSLVLASVSISPSPVAVAANGLCYDAGRAGWAVVDTVQHDIPVEIVFATLRRGPPSGAALDSVWYRETAIV